jgi:hypothetical protein
MNDVYLHLAARVAADAGSAPPTTAKLREALADLRWPLARLAECPLVTSARLFRAARLSELDSRTPEDRRTAAARYDLAIFIQLSNPEAVSELPDSRAVQELLRVMHMHGHDVAITPAQNVGVSTSGPAGRRLSLIHHLLGHEAESEETRQRDTRGDGPELELTEREVLVPIDPDSTPLRSITRAELGPWRTRRLVASLVRGTPNGDLQQWSAGDQMVLPHLYWELFRPIHGRPSPRPCDPDTASLRGGRP